MTMQRRRYLRGIGALGVAGVAGCLGSSKSDSHPNVTLGEPDRSFESSDVNYLAWGQQIPDETLPAPLEDRTISISDIEKPRLFTFFYSHCQTVCPVLISTMRNVQTHALNNGYADQVAFLPITFDPARDTADRLRTYAKKMNVDAAAEDWHFLRPESKARVKTVVNDEFGLSVTKKPSGTTTPSGTATPSGTTDTNSTTASGTGKYMFIHTALTLLVNPDGYVERAYRTKTPKADTIISDLKTVRQA